MTHDEMWWVRVPPYGAVPFRALRIWSFGTAPHQSSKTPTAETGAGTAQNGAGGNVFGAQKSGGSGVEREFNASGLQKSCRRSAAGSHCIF